MIDHKHEWVPVPGLESFPQRLCRCGAVKAAAVQAGENTLTLSPAGGTDLLRWSATAAPNTVGDLGMNVTTGRPSAFINGQARNLRTGQDVANGREWSWQQSPNSTTVTNVGTATAPTVTATTSVVSSTGDGELIGYFCTAAAGSEAGWTSTAFNQVQTQYVFDMECIARFSSSASNLRCFVGVAASNPIANQVGSTAINQIGFCFDTGIHTSTWRVIAGNTTTNSQTNTSLAYPLGNAIYFRINVTSTEVRFSAASNSSGYAPVLLATHTLNLPTSSAFMGPLCRVRTLDAVAKAVDISFIKIRQHPQVA